MAGDIQTPPGGSPSSSRGGLADREKLREPSRGPELRRLLAYALSKTTGEPLLLKGDVLSHTGYRAMPIQRVSDATIAIAAVNPHRGLRTGDWRALYRSDRKAGEMRVLVVEPRGSVCR